MDWEDLKTFAEVARAGSVRRAAASLGVHHSTVSRRVERLESDMATRLLNRRPEGYELTEAGEELLGVTRGFSDTLAQTARQIVGRDAELSGEVVVTMAEPLAIYAIVPRLAAFEARYPDLTLRIDATANNRDIARGHADVAIRMDNNPPETLVGKRLFPYFETVYASPDYLARHDLMSRPTDARWIGWEMGEGNYPQWVTSSAFPKVPVWNGFPYLPLQIAAARAGLGLAMLPCYLGDREPELVRVSARPPTPARDIWILTHADLRRTSRIRAVMQFAEEALRADKPLLTGVAAS